MGKKPKRRRKPRPTITIRGQRFTCHRHMPIRCQPRLIDQLIDQDNPDVARRARYLAFVRGAVTDTQRFDAHLGDTIDVATAVEIKLAADALAAYYRIPPLGGARQIADT